MGQTTAQLEALRERHKADATVLATARTRRDAVLGAVKSYPGWLCDFTSGSIAHQTVNDPVVDADCGVVLDRRSQPTLGPDGDGVGPTAVVHGVAETLALHITETYPLATIRITKRWQFNDGLLHLIGLVVQHQFKEEWWREHDEEWLGPEAPHGDNEVTAGAEAGGTT